jgi:hypothetical protein
MGGGLETLLDRKLPNPFRVSFRAKTTPQEGRAAWEPVVAATASLTIHLISALDAGLKAEPLRNALETFGSLLETTTTFNHAIYTTFKAQVIVS